MKRLLVTGATSYLGLALRNHLTSMPERYAVERVTLRDPDWRERSWAEYDAVFHAVGIAHQDHGRIPDERRAQYDYVNIQLAAQAAEKAKADGVSQFIFMSSISVYGEARAPGWAEPIGPDTPPAPANFYAESKLRAEEAILKLADESFRVAILRSPMVYGRGCRGNYPMLQRYAARIPFFPNFGGQRSLLFVGNFTEFVRILLDTGASGRFYPQDPQPIRTPDMVAQIARANGRKMRLTRLFNPALSCLWGLPLIRRVFGSLYYDPAMSAAPQPYQHYDLERAIRRAEGAK